MRNSLADRPTFDSDRRGITKVEVLVIVAVIGILIGVMPCASQKARENARRVQCANNLKNLGLALNEYHTSYSIFPPSSVWRSPKDWTELDIEQTAIGNNPSLGQNWAIVIIPQLESSTLYKSFDFHKPLPSAANQPARGTVNAVMLCPTDTCNRGAFNGSASKFADKLGDAWARGNYAANAGLGIMATSLSHPHGAADAKAWRNPLLCGIMGANTSLRISEIKDGATNTILLGEIRAGIRPEDPRGVWAMGNASGSALWGHGYTGEDNGPNCSSLRADGPCSGGDLWAAEGGGAKLAKMGMACDSDNHPNWQQTARSMHPGGVNVCMADGSVRFISDFIELGADGDPPRLGVWDKLNLSNDGEAVVVPDGKLP